MTTTKIIFKAETLNDPRNVSMIHAIVQELCSKSFNCLTDISGLSFANIYKIIKTFKGFTA